MRPDRDFTIFKCGDILLLLNELVERGMKLGLIMNLKSIIDCHSHSNYSADSQMLAHDGVRSALGAGIGGLAFTDHLDIDYPNREYNYTFDFDHRSKFLDELRNEFSGKAKILKGLELGFQPHIIDQAAQIVQMNDFDFVIGSVHAVDGYTLSENAGYYQGKNKQQAYLRYLEEVYNSVVGMDCFDVIGHIGYIRRYAPDEDRSLQFIDYRDVLDMILKKVVDKGKGIEVNTSGYHYKGLGTPIPNFDIIERYKELGGEMLTIGSDSHQARYVGNSFMPVLQRLKSIGFNYVTYFEERKPVFVKI
ncbi:MAG: Histidinol phosphate phosphatase HisJ family [candidate division TM6 bacterium GW2011_GWF2_37_49]|nr:MAG: Histidinol phosphate phosphatase HisJ family [candidate division TM6 bacterium GW2011_GWF2_37_49]